MRTSICLDESIRSPLHAELAIDLKSCRAMNLKAQRVGGLTAALEILEACQAAEIDCWGGAEGAKPAISQHADLALAACTGSALIRPISFLREMNLPKIWPSRYVRCGEARRTALLRVELSQQAGLGRSPTQCCWRDFHSRRRKCAKPRDSITFRRVRLRRASGKLASPESERGRKLEFQHIPCRVRLNPVLQSPPVALPAAPCVRLWTIGGQSDGKTFPGVRRKAPLRARQSQPHAFGVAGLDATRFSVGLPRVQQDARANRKRKSRKLPTLPKKEKEEKEGRGEAVRGQVPGLCADERVSRSLQAVPLGWRRMARGQSKLRATFKASCKPRSPMPMATRCRSLACPMTFPTSDLRHCPKSSKKHSRP